MKKYEYKVITIATSLAMSTKQYEKIAQEFEAELNKLGADGWELIQRMDGFFFFKRERGTDRLGLDDVGNSRLGKFY